MYPITCWRIWLVKTFGTLLSHIDHKQVEIICTYTRLQAGDSAVKGKTTLNIPIYCLIRWCVLVSVDPSVVLLSKLTTLITTISSYTISTWICSYKIIIKFCIPTLGPAVQASFLWFSAFWVIHCWWTSSLHSGQHSGGHLDILTSPVIQSISGLCFQSQECPKINFCLPKLETAKVVLSEWFL